MKIMYFDLEFPYLLKNDGTPTGGAAVEWKSWINGFINNGHEVQVITWVGANQFLGEKYDFELIEGIDLKRGIKVLKWFTHRYFKLMKVISANKPDIIVKESADAYTGILAIIAKFLKIKYLYRVANDLDTDDRYKAKLNYFDRKLFELGLNISDFILCQNNYQYLNLKERFSDKQIKILYNPIETLKNDFNNVVNNRFYIAWIGIFQHQKNLPAFLDIAKSLKEIKFKVAGKKDPHIDEKSKEALVELEKLPNVEMVGFLKREEVKPFLQYAYCLLNTSHFEGFSNTFLEAWITGTPVITTKNVNPDNLIEKNKLGIVSNSYSELKEILPDFVINRKYLEYSQNCMKYVNDKHNPNKLAKKFIEFINFGII